MNGNSSVNVTLFPYYDNLTTVSTDLLALKLLGCSLNHPECVAARWLYLLACPVLLVIGTIGNALSFVVLTRKLRHTAFGIYLSTLAIFDILTLWITLPRHFVKWMWLIDMRELSEWSCRGFRFLQFSFMNTSAWLLVAVTTERCMSIYFPTKVQYYGGTKHTRFVISAICSIHFLWNLHIFWTLGVEMDLAGTKVLRNCGYPSASAAYYWKRVHTWIDMCKLSVLPFLLMLIMNCCIVASLRQRVKDCRDKKSLLHGATTNAAAIGAAEKQARAASSKTMMLLPVSFFFLVATVPTFVETAYSHLTADGSDLSTKAKAIAALIDCLSTLLLYCNNAANFILYCLSGATFRKLCTKTLSDACPCKQAGQNDPQDETTYSSGDYKSTIVHKHRLADKDLHRLQEVALLVLPVKDSNTPS